MAKSSRYDVTVTRTQEVTGYEIREALKRWKTQRLVADQQFNASLFAFKDEKKANPEEIVSNFRKADTAIALLQELQQQYNSKVKVKVGKEDITLSLAVKLVGGAGRITNMWHKAATETGLDRYESRSMTRKTDEERAGRVVPQDKAIKLSDEAAKFAAAIRSAMAVGNSVKLDMEVPEGLLD